MFALTERLLLRPGWTDDAPALFSAIADEGIVRNLASAPWPYRMEHAEAFLATDRRAAEPVFLIFDRVGQRGLVGCVGLARARHAGEITDIGYWIARPHWGRGYATEAARAVVGVARDALRLPRLVSGHFIDNPASGRVLRKLGFRPTGTVSQRFSAGRGCEAACVDMELDLKETKAEAEPAVEGPFRPMMAA